MARQQQKGVMKYGWFEKYTVILFQDIVQGNRAWLECDNQAEIEGVVEGLCKIAKQEALKALREEAERGLKMRITNKLGLPEAFVKMAETDYQYKEKQYSVTSLLRGIRETILLRRYHNNIEQDVSDMIWLLFGTAVHNILEHQEEGKHELKEENLKIKIGDYTLSGRFDLYNAKTKTVTDYKTCSVWKMIFGDFADWRKQLLIYAYMLKRPDLRWTRAKWWR